MLSHFGTLMDLLIFLENHRKLQKQIPTNNQKQLIQILLIVFADADQILVNRLYTSVCMLYTPPAPPPQLLCMNNSPKIILIYPILCLFTDP